LTPHARPPCLFARASQGWNWYKFRDVKMEHLAACCGDKSLFIGDAFPDASQAR
jgi:hypothetical protein